MNQDVLIISCVDVVETGDPGCSKFFVSLEDELMVRFGSDRISGMFDQLGDIPIESK